MGKWSTGLKLALAALGVVLFATAIKSFVNWERSPGRDALFTVGTALVLSVVGAKFLPRGTAPALLTAGLVIGGYEYLKPQAETIGNNIAASMRGTAAPGGKPSAPKAPAGYEGDYISYKPPAMPAAPATPPPPPQQTAPAQTYMPVPAPQQPKVSDWAFLGGKLIEGGASVLGSWLGKGSAGSGDDVFARTVG